MHELSIAQAVIDQASETVRKEKAHRVSRITLTVGTLSGVDRDSLEFVFPLAAEHTCAEGARLVVKEIPARVRCRACKKSTRVHVPMILCAKCGSHDVEITAGRELCIQSLEILA